MLSKTGKRRDIYEYVLEKIQSGEWPKDYIINVKELAAQFQVHDNTVRSALAILKQDGYLLNRGGLGTWVA